MVIEKTIKKKGALNKDFTLLIISSIVIVSILIFLSAYPGLEIGVSVGAGGAGYGGTFNATEDTIYLYNFTINNTAGLKVTADTFNVTEVNITLPGGIVLNLSGSNVTNAAADFSNFSDGTLRWRNASGPSGFVINGSNNSAWFAFNATAAIPGEYELNITVLQYNVSGAAGTFNITTFSLNVTVNDTTAPGILATNFVRPTANFNYSKTFVLNGTITDNYKDGLGISHVNVSVYNTTGLNASYTVLNLSGNYWNVSINTSQFPDGIYNVTIYTNDTTNNVNSTNITGVRFDNTIPVIVPSNFTNPGANNYNYSGLLVLNVSASDITAGMNNILFNITNITGATGQNATILATKSGNSFNATINTSQFPDGVYNITAWANDSAGNENNTAAMLNIIFDNTNPTASFSCTPATVNAGSAVTCSCSPSDATAGINTSQTTYTASPSTSNTGTHAQTCSYYDTAGNFATSSATYVVELSSPVTSSSGSGTTATEFTYSKTIPQNGKEFSEIKTLQYELKVKERVKIKINNEEHHVGIRAVSETKATIEIASDPVQVELAIGEDAKIDVNADGYYDIYVKLNGIADSKADVTIEYLNEAIPEGSSAVSTTGEDVTSETGGIDEGEGLGANLTWLYWVIGIIVLVLIIWFFMKKKK